MSANGKGLVSQAGAVLLWEAMRVTGLDPGLSAGLAQWRAPRAVHDPGKVIADLAAAVALGGDCLADLPRSLRAIRSARAAAREQAWALAGDAAPGGDGGLVTVDLDATVVVAHSENRTGESGGPSRPNTIREPAGQRPNVNPGPGPG